MQSFKQVRPDSRTDYTPGEARLYLRRARSAYAIVRLANDVVSYSVTYKLWPESLE
jgi:hypothetical protein